MKKAIATQTIFIFVLGVIALAVILAFTIPAIKQGIENALAVISNLPRMFSP